MLVAALLPIPIAVLSIFLTTQVAQAILGLLGVLILPISIIITLAVTAKAEEKKQTPLMKTLKKKYGAFFGTMILAGILFGIVMGIILGIYFLVLMAYNGQVNVLSLEQGVLGAIIMMIASIFIGIFFIFTQHAIVYDNKSFFKAVARAWKVGYKHYWQSLWKILLIYLVGVVVIMAISLIFLIILSFTVKVAATREIIIQIISSIVQQLVFVIAAIATALLYRRLDK